MLSANLEQEICAAKDRPEVAMDASRWIRLGAVGIVCTSLAGCASFWDDVTSRDFSVKQYFSPSPDPIEVLKTSTDGDSRAKAYSRLEKPYGQTTDGLQSASNEEVVRLLTHGATAEPQPLCRMAAIRSLGKYPDPRCATSLIRAYDAAETLAPDLAYMVRCQAISALGETKQPEAAVFLAEVAKKPTKSDIADRERGQYRDVRLAAVRALKNYPGSEMAAITAQQLMANEKDVAVRDRARETYAAVTGQDPNNAPPLAPTPDKNNPILTVGHTQPASRQN